MSYQTWRDEFIARMSREGMQLETIRAVLRAASTLQRLAVAQCNGDWPADNGQRRVKPCQECESLWAPSVLKRARYQHAVGTGTYQLEHVCPDCRTARRVRVLLQERAPGWRAIFGGDPRGCVLKLARVEATRADINSGRAETIGVPARG